MMVSGARSLDRHDVLFALLTLPVLTRAGWEVASVGVNLKSESYAQ